MAKENEHLHKIPENQPTPPAPGPNSVKELEGSLILTVSARVTDTDAATTAKYGTAFVAPFPCTLVSAKQRHGTAGTDAGSVTLDVEKLADGTAKGSGVSMLAGTFNLKSTANTVQSQTPTPTIANRNLAAGEAVALKPTGVLTSVNDVVVTMVFKALIKNLPL